MPTHGIPCYKIGIDAGGPPVTVDSRTFVPDPVREQAVSNIIKKYIPQVSVYNFSNMNIQVIML